MNQLYLQWEIIHVFISRKIKGNIRILKMSQVTESILFRQKLYENFKDSGMLDKLKTSLRINLLDKIQKPAPSPNTLTQLNQQKKPLYLRDKFLACIVAEYLQKSHKQYTFSILLPEAHLDHQECLSFSEISEITNLGNVVEGDRSYLEILVEEWMKFRAVGVSERSTQTDYSEPVSKKLEDIEKKYRKQIDYWKLIPNAHSSIRRSGQNTSSHLQDLSKEQRMKQQLQYERKKLRRQLQANIRAQLEKKYQDKYGNRVKQIQKAHQGRLFELKNREKTILDGLDRKKKDLEAKAHRISNDQQAMIKKYEIKLSELELQYKLKLKQLENKEKQFWKKELELRAKKKEYEDSIRLVKQKVVEETLQF